VRWPTTRHREDGLTHVVVELEQDDEGWPPVSTERVWAERVGRHRYRIDNMPFFAQDLATDDVVAARPARPGQYPTVIRVVEPSANATVRVICFRAGPLQGDLRRAARRLRGHGVHLALADPWGMVAVSVTPAADMARLQETLDQGSHDGAWEYEESRLRPAWLAATATG
jgi:hypothetical protein